MRLGDGRHDGQPQTASRARRGAATNRSKAWAAKPGGRPGPWSRTVIRTPAASGLALRAAHDRSADAYWRCRSTISAGEFSSLPGPTRTCRREVPRPNADSATVRLIKHPKRRVAAPAYYSKQACLGERTEAFPSTTARTQGNNYPSEVAGWPCLSRCARPLSTSDSFTTSVDCWTDKQRRLTGRPGVRRTPVPGRPVRREREAGKTSWTQLHDAYSTLSAGELRGLRNRWMDAMEVSPEKVIANAKAEAARRKLRASRARAAGSWPAPPIRRPARRARAM